jgi:sugar phosphate isomerase/epimerase
MKFARREFVGLGAAGLAQLIAARYGFSKEEKLPLAFSTLGCPGWEWSKILDFAQQNGFAAVELRGLKGNMDLPSLPEFASDKIAQRKQEVAAHDLKLACVSSSTELHKKDPTERAKTLADGKRFIDLASALEVPYVRVFGNKIDGPKEETIDRVVAGFQELAEYAGPRKVTVIIESHGDFVDSPTLQEVLTKTNSSHAALLWDAHHTFADGHEDPAATVQALGQYIRHTHLKDSVPMGQQRNYVLTGTGDVPVKKQIAALRKIDYKGYYCFEWEKVWHQDLLEPEVAFPNYVKVVRGYWSETNPK